jgi:hypothetical protein
MQSLPRARTLLGLLVLLSWSSVLALCQPPDGSLDWRHVGDVVQNQRVASSRTYNVTGWQTAGSVTNHGSSAINDSMTATYETNTLVSASILTWRLGSSNRSTWTHTFGVSVPARSRVVLRHQRREEVRDLVWDVMCAWRHRVTGEARLTTYGRNYTGTTWRIYDAYDIRTEAL